MKFATKIAVTITALSLPLGPALEPAGLEAQTSSTADAEAFGTFVDITGLFDQKTPHAELVSGAAMNDASALSTSVPGIVAAENLFATTTGAGDADASSATSSSTLENVSLLDGLITADVVVAISSSWFDGGEGGSNADGSTFTNLVVDGQSFGPNVAPNTRIDVPGVGTVVLNEQIKTGDGINSAGMTVNMIHVVLKDALTGVTTGEIVVGSARSTVTR